ncbi:MAG: hypothetical protein R6U98_07775, partial [Pirellulaceae bacterium]
MVGTLDEYVSEGHNDISSNMVKLRKYEYTSHTADDTGKTIYPTSKIIDYKTDQDTIETQFSYTYHEYEDGGVTKERNQVLQKTTTLPSISSTQNGSGSSATRTERFDEHGNLVWLKDERGFLTHYEYDVDTGARVRMIQDVDVSQVSDEPSGWSTPTGGGAHLVTDYTIDDLGRVTQTLGPVHDVDGTDTRTASWTVYNEDGEETRRASGHAVETTPGSGTFDDYTIVGPVSVTQYDHDGRVLDQFQAEPDTTAPANPLTSIAGETFSQDEYTSWTANQYTKTRLTATARYYDIPTGSSDGDSDGFTGTEGTHYDVTEYGYDDSGRRVWSETPGGTITHTFFESRGLVSETWVGTDDVPSSDHNSDGSTDWEDFRYYVEENGSAPTGTNMVLVTE